ncbi:hydroxymethylglutaryl-CoA lyase [Ammoniphilus oxalaticus]|uniref:Hydroxymethylglutaryl-CoA lyase n=1 Tax=Ammoniphilus oxalaticus TaxID=66863 RepID=A0A419SJ91_9BACL|nr:hydroxymethylglutaryl-CoA lyase [Ammoniphilus oxalaticus]RKD24083.1 hydroxymethylglutaryl-CoA lyase [Ammoniphilus oxalaticus]
MQTVQIVEVGPRDGLQNERNVIETSDKLQLIALLADAGLKRIEATSFVHPRWIPQLADADTVARHISNRVGVEYSALVPNKKGLERAIVAGLKEIAVFMSASEAHNKQNINKSIRETYSILSEVINQAVVAGIRVRGYVSTVFGCPFAGDVSIDDVTRVMEQLFKMGVYEVSLGDTIGIATPKQVEERLTVLLRYFPVEKLACHFHDTRGTALANVYAALTKGIRVFDSSIGGLGGCPYAPGATGNVATEDLVNMLEGMGIATGVDLHRLLAASSFMQTKLGRALPSKMLSFKQRGGY